jgi:hypothetical protein
MGDAAEAHSSGNLTAKSASSRDANVPALNDLAPACAVPRDGGGEFLRHAAHSLHLLPGELLADLQTREQAVDRAIKASNQFASTMWNS